MTLEWRHSLKKGDLVLYKKRRKKLLCFVKRTTPTQIKLENGCCFYKKTGTQVQEKANRISPPPFGAMDDPAIEGGDDLVYLARGIHDFVKILQFQSVDRSHDLVNRFLELVKLANEENENRKPWP